MTEPKQSLPPLPSFWQVLKPTGPRDVINIVGPICLLLLIGWRGEDFPNSLVCLLILLYSVILYILFKILEDVINSSTRTLSEWQKTIEFAGKLVVENKILQQVLSKASITYPNKKKTN